MNSDRHPAASAKGRAAPWAIGIAALVVIAIARRRYADDSVDRVS